jgi:cytochrome c oxidase cbb3-type subunit 3
MRVTVLALSAMLLRAQGFDAAQVERGRQAFQANCGFCHGDDATGNRAPDLIRSAKLSHDVFGDVLGPVVRNGIAEKGMPSFPTLTVAQVADIAAFLHHQADVALHSSHVPADYALAKLLTGNADRGKEFFNGAGGCGGCHSVTGDLAGIAGKCTPRELEQRFLHPQSSAKAHATVHLSNGEVVEGTVAHMDEFDIAITGKDGWYRSWKRAQVRVEIRDPLKAHRDLMPKYTDANIHDVFAFLAAQKPVIKP